ncbi:hypothetical protein VNO77_22251 [Canavalia gladiata]|uniref:Uncharacterized protein n=1 Tax=Canavalia gladiata TaxID=3824 RepID=A0AAN9L2P8_CANGL
MQFCLRVTYHSAFFTNLNVALWPTEHRFALVSLTRDHHLHLASGMQATPIRTVSMANPVPKFTDFSLSNPN